jgi:hypothetical protein
MDVHTPLMPESVVRFIAKGMPRQISEFLEIMERYAEVLRAGRVWKRRVFDSQSFTLLVLFHAALRALWTFLFAAWVTFQASATTSRQASTAFIQQVIPFQ